MTAEPLMRSSYRGTALRVRGRIRRLEKISEIFVCPLEPCEYAMTALSRENIEAVRRTHVSTCHPELLPDLLWREHFSDT